MKILVVNGANLNMLGTREPHIYGTNSLSELESNLLACASEKGVQLDFFQSNSEGEIINKIHGAYGNADAIIINAGAYSHYSYAIRDALSAVAIPAVEVHISNVYKREEFRHNSVIAPVCCGTITGLGMYGYVAALNYLCDNTKI
ncbi:MAG: type II 3-dehydroquinate dehydratase [Clostridia bacterium]|nr:type II 3-dehydroquinate dehydratase [Clostridia bacterium]